MNQYFYKGRNTRGKKVEGNCRAETLEEARQQLEKLGYQIALLHAQEETQPAKKTLPERRPTPRLGPDFNRLRPYLQGVFVIGLMWLAWDLVAPAAHSTKPAVEQQHLVVDAGLPGVSLSEGERLEFVFPDIPYSVEKNPKEVLSAGRVHLELDLRTSRRPSYCLLRCRSPQFEKRIELQ